mmetsp:Transcript_37465/g.27618  ORF Transcript_37465/g.27618 Transcript_37465/m.27618 type:complete len:94 (+) Transcript_37465:67-348(+)
MAISNIRAAILVTLLIAFPCASVPIFWEMDLHKPVGTFFDLYFGYEIPLEYGTSYQAGVGPYDSDYALWSDITDLHHFEELSFYFKAYASGYF